MLAVVPKPATAEERRWMARVASIGCIVCRNLLLGKTPPEVTSLHHIRTGYGVGQRAPHNEVIPLCPLHHQGPPGVGYHSAPGLWQKEYGTELELLEQVREILGETSQI